MMQNRRKLLFMGLTLLVLVGLAVGMYVSGRGHTVYLDNKTIEYEGVSYPAVYRAEVIVGNEEAAQLGKRERGMATWIGRSFQMRVHMTGEKDGEPIAHDFSVTLPFHDDGIVLNLPALAAGLPREAYLSIFVPQVPAGEPEEEVPAIDELDVTGIEGG